jgi:hypothetical protein
MHAAYGNDVVVLANSSVHNHLHQG